MARQRILEEIPCRASSNVSAVVLDANGNYSSGGLKLNVVVMLDLATNADEVRLPSGTTVPPFGVTNSGPTTTGQSVSVVRKGRVKIECASAITYGDPVMIANTSGQVATATAATLQYLVGRAMSTTANANEYVEVELSDMIAGKVTTA